jgi:hypothetical protein
MLQGRELVLSRALSKHMRTISGSRREMVDIQAGSSPLRVLLTKEPRHWSDLLDFPDAVE